jgi:signal transduction histidine kinase/DNA-binding response OmpR family regulator
MLNERINILVVDDVPEKLIALEAILEDLGHNIVAVQSGREALRQLLFQDFALILLDVNMPEMDGFETAALIRQRPRSEHTPIIFITGFSDETHVSRGYSLGAVDYILTPVVPEVLKAKVAVFADLFKKTELVKRQAEQQVAIAHEQAARAAAETDMRRAAYIADASEQLAASLDYDETVTCAVRLPIPILAEIAVLQPSGGSRRGERPRIASIHPTIEAALTDQTGFLLGPELQACSNLVMRSGRVECMAPGELVRSHVGDDLRHEFDRRPFDSSFDPSIAAAMVLPLVARGKVLGTLTLARIREGAYSQLDVSLAGTLAGRIAVAIDNANLFRKIQEGDRRKDEFLATLSHELRNPLAAISNALECMEVAADSPNIVEEARAILRRQILYVVRLVDDLLDVSRITRGKIRLRKEIVELRDILDGAITAVRSMVDERGHRLAVTLPKQPVHLHGDRTRLEQAIGNLLNNAAKYTPPGGQVDLRAEIDRGQVAIHVADTGAGIPADQLHTIFDLFAQGDRTLDHSQGGLGIGLTLVRSLITLHGGEIEAASDGPGHGSEFTIRLPVATTPSNLEATAAVDSAPAAVNGTPPANHRRILLVDDNVDLATATAALLRAIGHEVHLCHDGREALERFPEVRPEVVFVDIGLPGISGHDVARAIRTHPEGEGLLLVAMTGYGQADDRRRSREAGFDLHLVKPVSLNALENVLSGMGSQEPQAIGR